MWKGALAAVQGQSKLSADNIITGKRRRGSSSDGGEPSKLGAVVQDFVSNKKSKSATKKSAPIGKKVDLPMWDFTDNHPPAVWGPDTTRLVKPEPMSWHFPKDNYSFYKVVAENKGAGTLDIQPVRRTFKSQHIGDEIVTYFVTPVWEEADGGVQVISRERVGMGKEFYQYNPAGRYIGKSDFGGLPRS